MPVHGKPSLVSFTHNSVLFDGLSSPVTVGRYHSLFAKRDVLPECFEVTSETKDGVIMAIEHKSEPIGAVQFHPESIMSLDQDGGHQIIENVMTKLLTKG